MVPMAQKHALERMRLSILGQVQGVGFRPYLYRLAQQHQYTGFVFNDKQGVIAEIQGSNCAAFVEEMLAHLPPLAEIKAWQAIQIPPDPTEENFAIRPSEKGLASCTIAADTSPCDECLRELLDPNSRFYLYPFLNCTNCGPRATISQSLPYDRAQTTMAAFAFCPACAADYNNPHNRRFHAQPTACCQCGPQISLPVADMVAALRAGEILAVKGIGGYQLLCDGQNNAAVSRLRAIKKRDSKPFAIMMLNAESARRFVTINAAEETILHSAARPIVLLRKKKTEDFACLASGLARLGVMLPASPLAYLIFHAWLGKPSGMSWLGQEHPLVLVATSANFNSEPLFYDDIEASKQFADVCLLVSNNRQICQPMDDSVCVSVNNKPLFIRRARGYIPQAIPLPTQLPSVLALGGHLKTTFCITRGDEAFVSQHIGSLNNRATIEFYHQNLNFWLKYLNVKIEAVGCDKHPDFYTSKLAASFNRPVYNVQHHHAHLLAVLVENNLKGNVLGLALDGYGYGESGEAWGGEVFLLDDNCHYQRLGSFQPLPLPGGDKAVKEPWRMAAALLHEIGNNEQISQRFAHYPQAALVQQLLCNPSLTAKTSSCGRLFDAVSAVLGVCEVSHYEGQAAMMLEALVRKTEILPDGWLFHGNQFNLLPLCKQLIDMDKKTGANYFHGTLVAGLCAWIEAIVAKTAIRHLVLGGGCFANVVLTEGLTAGLAKKGITCYLPKSLPVNDGGIALGQAWAAANMR